MKTSLETIWHELRGEFGDRIEPFESWRAADELRRYWRPQKVRVVLLAESHVFTDASEASIRVGNSRFTDDSIPNAFVKLVYCLGYGENELLSRKMQANHGTRQFWEISYSSLHRVEHTSDFSNIHKTKTRSLSERIQNKLSILQELKEQGIWLLDASLAALYPKPKVRGMYESCIAKSWPYLFDLISEAHPEKLVVIGKGVRNRLESRIATLGVSWDWIHQPQARLKSEQHMENFQRLYGVVHGAMKVGCGGSR